MDKNILMVAIRAAIEAGAKIMSVYTDPNADFEIEKKADNSPLTIADRKAHEVISKILSSTNIPVLSEEGKKLPFESRKEWNELWIVDPLDGTKEFIKKNGEFTVNIAYVKNGKPEAGVIYIPVKEELYLGDCECGAFKIENINSISEDDTFPSLTSKAIHLPIKENREKFVVVASRSHLSPETQDFIEKIKESHPNIETVSKGSSLKLCLIAEGKADIYPRFAPTMEWDTAAGHAIIRAAGKEVYHTDEKTPLTYNKEDLLNPWFISK
ncbi:3'(2'),5'-bisphosphate nucleotidase CysQ [Bacteroides caecigallinarum]|uniref:3'(2'),5'-bisphosphate nucleotidase CysQ n=1 Tax=Bacteroides caecigallinarum TaxID=1411144 RepID=UPI001F177778|nr:3'(2'),5'-bisphosphate nucleotidase CysQ [Bacteroides caecigallinarum]MCF2592295.1 3'(2'),5'-bisphosphate nucleotidase CysQ [Bacteroides caecigallinarum]